uniref:Putative secreted protein n=1 Tax=Anopheles darlingi TaxID=43151 RepID=A0A2M4DPQ0_ANODA
MMRTSWATVWARLFEFAICGPFPNKRNHFLKYLLKCCTKWLHHSTTQLAHSSSTAAGRVHRSNIGFQRGKQIKLKRAVAVA